MFSIHSFSFEKGSNRQNHSSSGSLHPVKKSTPSKIPPPPPPLTAIWKTLLDCDSKQSSVLHTKITSYLVL